MTKSGKSWRFAGFDDSFRIEGSISELKGEKAILAGCVTAGTVPEGFMFTTIEIDGVDATEKISLMVRKSKFYSQLRCIFLSGITFGGFNIVDIRKLSDEVQIPVISVMRKFPDIQAMKKALLNLPLSHERWNAIEKAGKVLRIAEVYVQVAGCGVDEAEEYLRLSTGKGKIPEPLRLAHMVATAFVHGESRGKV
jgi:hypothetical protein